MAGKVEDLLLRMNLDTEGYKRSMSEARQEIKRLKAVYNTLDNDDTLGNTAKARKENLRAQVDAQEEVLRQLNSKIDDTRARMETLEKDSPSYQNAAHNLGELQKNAANANTNLAELKETLTNFSLNEFNRAMSSWAELTQDFKLATGGIVDGAKELNAAADALSVSREGADAGVYKIANGMPGVDEGWLEELRAWNREMIQELPLTYEELAQIEAAAMQAGGVAAGGVREFAAMYAKLQSATDLAGDAGVAQVGQIAKLTGVTVTDYSRLGSVIVALGNNLAATESEIVQTAQGAASALASVGMSADDVLALSGAAVGLGMEPQAASTALSKMAEDMARAAELGGEKADIYGALLGASAEQFSARWKTDAAQTFLDFFVALGQQTADGSESILSYLDDLGIKEVRQGRLAKNFARVNDEVGKALTLARAAWADNTALDAEAELFFATTASRRIMAENKRENAKAALGDSVKAMREPWDDFFADLYQKWAEVPTWAQDAAAGVTLAVQGLGDLVNGVGSTAQSLYYTGRMIKDVRENAPALKSGLKIAGKGLLGAAVAGGAVAGVVELAELLNRAMTDTTAISEGLASLEIHIDETSKQETLNALETVKAAVRGLNAPEDREKYAAISRLVRLGYGTAGMLGQALGYEQATSEERLEGIYADYGEKIGAAEEALLAAADQAQRDAAQARLDALGAEMQNAADAEKAAYGQAINELISGAIAQRAGAQEKLARIAEEYSLLDTALASNGPNKTINERQGILNDADFLNRLRALELGDAFIVNRGAYDPSATAKALYAALAEDVEGLLTDTDLSTLLASILSSGALAGADTESISGDFLALLQAMDIKSIGEQGAQDWREIGQYSAGGLGQGLKASKEPEEAAESVAGSLLTAAKRVLAINSPSREFYKIGENTVQGLIDALAAKKAEAAAAMRALGAALTAEAEAACAQVAALFAALNPAGARFSGSGARSAGTNAAGAVLNQSFYISGGVERQQQVKRLAREMAALSRNQNAGLGIAGR